MIRARQEDAVRLMQGGDVDKQEDALLTRQPAEDLGGKPHLPLG